MMVVKVICIVIMDNNNVNINNNNTTNKNDNKNDKLTATIYVIIAKNTIIIFYKDSQVYLFSIQVEVLYQFLLPRSLRLTRVLV